MLAASCGVSRAFSACQHRFCGATTSLLAASTVLDMSSRSELCAAGQFFTKLAWTWY